MKLILIGLRGTGKSTTGRLLASRLGWLFLDTDEIVQARAGASIREIFEQQGESGFRHLEAEVVQECAGSAQAVIATGGGAVLHPANVAALRRDGFVVQLTAEPEELWRRIEADRCTGPTRPKLLASVQSGVEELRALLRQRAGAYAQARDIEIPVQGRSPEQVAEAILAALRACGRLAAEPAAEQP